ncbi:MULTISPECIES: GumC family protein [Gluconacetobacter]|uniref:GumC family protein n=1 Tax=Gluconacetobacter TaxID=89583 RepID=UPI001FE675F0|nr:MULTISPECIES: polysaccharide biosynthesis tyrosine autokinase [Gluconacetobacter]
MTDRILTNRTDLWTSMGSPSGMNDFSTADHLAMAPPARDGRAILLHGIRLVRRYRTLFLAVGAGTFLVGCGVTLSLKRTFMATATVVVSPASMDQTALPNAQPTDRLQDDELATQAGLLQSRDVAAAVLRSLPPPPVPQTFSLRGALCVHTHLLCAKAGPAHPDSVFQAQIDRLQAAVIVAPGVRSRIISISVNAADGQRAADLANSFVTEYQQIALDTRRGNLNRTAAWVDNRTAQLRERWLEAATKANMFNTAHHLTNTGDDAGNGPLIDRQISETAISLTQAQNRLAAAQARADALSHANAEGESRALITLAQQPILVAAANTLTQLESTRMQKASTMGPHHPELAGLDRQIAAARVSMARETSAALASIDAEVASTRAEVTRLTRNLDTLREQAGTQSSPQAEYRMLVQEAQSAREVYEAFLGRSKEMVDRVELLQPPVAFVSHATAPDAPTFPNRKKLLMGVVILSLAAAGGAVFLRDLLSPGFGEIEQLRAMIGMPLLTAIPRVPRHDGRMIRRHVVDAPFSPASEAVRSLLAQLSLSAPMTERGRVVAITSASAAEGKSSLAYWLATLARAGGQPALVIDGDHRESRQRRDIAPVQRGLSELLSGTASVADVVQHDTESGVDFIPAGAPGMFSFDTAEIARLRSLLKDIGRSYNLIIIDSPALQIMPDGLVYGAVADQTVFVCRWLQTSRTAILSSLEQLRSYGAQVAGVVVSMAEDSAAAFPGSSQYLRHRPIALPYDS